MNMISNKNGMRIQGKGFCHLLKLGDLSPEEILSILGLADQLKYERAHHIDHPLLKGRTLGMIFQKASTRTRVSFEVGMTQLGGTALFLSGRDLQIGRGEPIQDTARVLSRYVDGLMIRTFAQQEVEDLAKYGSVPVINGLTDYAHPCQVLADLLTIRERKGALKGLKICFVGDGNNVANSLIVGCLKMGMEVAIACPDGYRPDPGILTWAAENGAFSCSSDVEVMARGADVVYTDVWASMGQEAEVAGRLQSFAGFQVNDALMAAAHPRAMVLHCLPAHRGEEITENVLEAHADEIFDQAENRLHTQKAILVKLMQS